MYMHPLHHLLHTGDHIDNLKVGKGQRRSRRHQHSVSQKTIEVAVVVDKLTADHHGTDTLPYVLTLMNVVSVRMNVMGYIFFIFVKCMRNICTHSQEHMVCACVPLP